MIILRTGDSMLSVVCCSLFFQAEDGIRYLVRSRGLGDVYKRQREDFLKLFKYPSHYFWIVLSNSINLNTQKIDCIGLSLIHI